MKGYIPDIKVEEIRNRTSIVDVVSDYVTLKKTGRNFVGLCPFHKEKTPSFTVTPDRQMFYCFGCGEGGNAFAFLMKIGQMTYPEAVRHLAKKTGVVLSERTSRKERAEDSVREQLVRINEMAAGYYTGNLFSTAGKEALAYLRQRGLREETIRAFRLGFALHGWHHLRDFLEKEKISPEQAERAGLLVAGKDGRLYDRFRGRLIFPVEDVSGRVIAFGGRLMGDGEPKYLNSPESVVYVKGRNLYALNRAKEAIRKQGYVIVVEGYFDLISLCNAGITHAVATLGTALTKEQVDLIGRYTTHVVALFDPDEAGQKALTRSLPLFLAGNLNARALVLPDELDPDDYIQAHGGGRLLELIGHAPSLVDYYVDHVLGGAGGFEKERDSLRKAVAFIGQIENVVDRNLFIKRVSERLGIDQELLKREIPRTRPEPPDRGSIPWYGKADIEKLEMDLIHLLLVHPAKAVPAMQTGILNYFFNSDLKQFGETLRLDAAGLQPWDAVERVSGLKPGPLRDGLMKKIMEAQPFDEEQTVDRIIADTTRQIRRRWYRVKHRTLQADIVKAQETGDADLCSRLLAEKVRLNEEKKTLGI